MADAATAFCLDLGLRQADIVFSDTENPRIPLDAQMRVRKGPGLVLITFERRDWLNPEASTSAQACVARGYRRFSRFPAKRRALLWRLNSVMAPTWPFAPALSIHPRANLAFTGRKAADGVASAQQVCPLRSIHRQRG